MFAINDAEGPIKNIVFMLLCTLIFSVLVKTCYIIIAKKLLFEMLSIWCEIIFATSYRLVFYLMAVPWAWVVFLACVSESWWPRGGHIRWTIPQVPICSLYLVGLVTRLWWLHLYVVYAFQLWVSVYFNGGGNIMILAMILPWNMR